MRVILGDITTFCGNAIVNAANPELKRGDGVCGAIFDACPNEEMLIDACSKYGKIETRYNRMTSSFGMDAKEIIHAVGPVFNEGNPLYSRFLLLDTYREIFATAWMYKIKSLAIPCISTGIYGYPKQEAAEVAVSVARLFPEFDVSFYCFDQENYDIYNKLLITH